MEQPCKELSRDKLLELYHRRVFYRVIGTNKGTIEATLDPCILDVNHEWDVECPLVQYFDDNMRLSNTVGYAYWHDLYDSWEKADKRVKHINKLYSNGFYRKPFVSLDILEKHKGEMIKIEKYINYGLKDYPNFLGIEFVDVGANGIQVRGYHKEVKRYSYGEQPTIEYDFSNKYVVMAEFVDMWKRLDNPENVGNFKEFLRFGNKYGWD